jgi:hypothetical protein
VRKRLAGNRLLSIGAGLDFLSGTQTGHLQSHERWRWSGSGGLLETRGAFWGAMRHASRSCPLRYGLRAVPETADRRDVMTMLAVSVAISQT